MKNWVLVAAMAVLGGCAGPTEPEAVCIALVNVDDVLFSTGEGGPPDPDEVVVEAYLTVTGKTGCLDQGEPQTSLEPGQSNFLDVGTTLHAVSGFSPAERLVYMSTVTGDWQVLVPHTP